MGRCWVDSESISISRTQLSARGVVASAMARSKWHQIVSYIRLFRYIDTSIPERKFTMNLSVLKNAAILKHIEFTLRTAQGPIRESVCVCVCVCVCVRVFFLRFFAAERPWGGERCQKLEVCTRRSAWGTGRYRCFDWAFPPKHLIL